jgi:hypothetical protein
MSTELVRAEVLRLRRQAPFRPFLLNLENGSRLAIEHPENIAFDPSNGTAKGSGDFYVLSGPLRFFGTFDAVTSVTLAENAEEPGD